MTTTRINHTGHTHPSTTAARTECRKAMKAMKDMNVELHAPVVAKFPTATVGKGKSLHLAMVTDSGELTGVRCGAGLTRNKSNSSLHRNADAIRVDITCRTCASKIA